MFSRATRDSPVTARVPSACHERCYAYDSAIRFRPEWHCHWAAIFVTEAGAWSCASRSASARGDGTHADFLYERRKSFLDSPNGIWQDFGIVARTFLVLCCPN